MVSVCLYFQVHQPFRMAKYSVFDIGNHSKYFDDEKNKQILNKVSEKCYIPMTKMLLRILRNKPEFKISFSFSGTALEQFEEYNPKVLELFKEAVDTKQVEVLSETYYHSLSFLHSRKEFKNQVKLHDEKVRELFKVRPSVFRNTELIYNNDLARFVENLGYKAILTEGADHILGWKSPNYVYRPKNLSRIRLLLKNYRLSDDIAFRFGNRSWSEYPLTAPKFASWISSINGSGETVNLFMDYETFGEHQWKDTGIFKFVEHLPYEILKNKDNNFMTPSMIIKNYDARGELDVPNTISWADLERDLSAWTGNKMQVSALENLYMLEASILKTKDASLINTWRKLQTSDHFYYMCTKWFSDGDVHKYFNPYESPYDSFISFMNILHDIKLRLEEVKKKRW